MKNNHLTYFKIENFKKFESLEVNDIGQFNLIVGDNNVGKTCLLEALLFDEDGQQMLNNFYLALKKRELKFEIERRPSEINGKIVYDTIVPKGNYFKQYVFGKFSEEVIFKYAIENINSKNQGRRIISLKIDEINNQEKLSRPIITSINIPWEDYVKQFVFFTLNPKKKSELFWIYDYDETILNFPLISFNDTPLDEETRGIYENLIKEGKKQILINSLKVISPEILDIDLITGDDNTNFKNNFYISFNNTNEPPILLNSLGDGFKRIFYIVLKALSLKGKRILIDEIEIGIHYSKMKDFWINIMKVCTELDVQLFATTHSKECSEAFVEATKSLDSKIQSEIRLIELYETKGKIYSGTIKEVDNIEYSVKNLPFRGENIYG